MPEVAEAHGKIAVMHGIPVGRALRGCTPCDHAPSYEDLATPVHFLAQPMMIPRGRVRRETSAAVVATYHDLVAYSDDWWARLAPNALRVKWAAESAIRPARPANLYSIQSWMPRQTSMYDVAEQVIGPTAPRLDDPSQALFLEAQNRARREWVRRLAFGLPPTGDYSEETMARAVLADPPTIAAHFPEVYAVQRRANLPSPAESAYNRQRCVSLLSYPSASVDLPVPL
jgi:hypothetical protein